MRINEAESKIGSGPVRQTHGQEAVKSYKMINTDYRLFSENQGF
jgi:hypothetical protein